jgi:hypothetical protein
MIILPFQIRVVRINDIRNAFRKSDPLLGYPISRKIEITETIVIPENRIIYSRLRLLVLAMSGRQLGLSCGFDFMWAKVI